MKLYFNKYGVAVDYHGFVFFNNHSIYDELVYIFQKYDSRELLEWADKVKIKNTDFSDELIMLMDKMDCEHGFSDTILHHAIWSEYHSIYGASRNQDYPTQQAKSMMEEEIERLLSMTTDEIIEYYGMQEEIEENGWDALA